jgi:hypothetical protein
MWTQLQNHAPPPFWPEIEVDNISIHRELGASPLQRRACYWEMSAVYYENHTQHKHIPNTTCIKNAKAVNARMGGLYSYHCAQKF